MSKPPCLAIGAIVLAAGAATRMGKLKQLLSYRGRPLIQHSIAQALEAGFGPVIVVVGAEAPAVRAAIAALPVSIADNRNWRLGMGSSLAAGMRHLRKLEPESGGVAILLSDQPLVSANHLRKMRRLLHATDAPAVAAEYDGTLGVPALFKRKLFGALESVTPEAGAREILRNSGIEVTAFPLPEAAVDIDTPEEFASLQSGAADNHS